MSPTSPDALPLVRARGLTRIHENGGRSTPILRGVDFELGRGEFLCIMGPSGSGKTTLLHLLSGLDQPSGGELLLDGTDLSRLGAAERTRRRRDLIAHVFQFFNLLPNLTLRENVGLPLAIRGEDPAAHAGAIDGILDRLGLGPRQDARPHQLSGGEMQRASIARALAGGQPVLLCDEPTGNLSQKAGLEVMEMLQSLRDRDGKSVLLVTHNPRDATYADRVLFLVDGRIADGVALRGPGIAVEDVHGALATLAI
ncbi:MAG: ABC transporter ATP-binding protein [Planctomycetota bacterium]